MGCASSKESKKRCRSCQSPYSPMPRSYSMHVIHPPQQKGDNYHLVALTSTTLGSLQLLDDPPPSNSVADDGLMLIGKEPKGKEEFSMGLIEAKTWSRMIEEKIPKMPNPRTPNMTPPGEPETINTWELMEGLEEDFSPCRFANHIRSFSFDVNRDPHCLAAVDSPKMSFDQQQKKVNHVSFSPKDDHVKPKPIWDQLAEEEEEVEDVIEEEEEEEEANKFMDSNIISVFRKSMQELSPSHPFHLKPIQEVMSPEKVGKGKLEKDRVIVYFTSLRGVRKTYEDSCHVRVILKGLGVRVDERDVSMHSGFKEELRQLLGGGGFSLPRVFIGNKYIGGADEIRQMHEEGTLEKAVGGCEKADDDGGEGGGVCEACGDVRFVPCETCSGSCKIYYEEEEEEEEEEEDEDEDGEEVEEGNQVVDYGFQRCPDCNENGLIRCPICCFH